MSIQDQIERVMVLRAPRERVWAALTEAAELSRWFGDTAEIDLRPGGELVLGWEEHGVGRCRIEVVEPPRRFAYRWHAPGADEDAPIEAGPNTLVEFTLDEVPEGTRLTLIESGFASLPSDIAAKAFEDNTGGWASELGELAAYIEAAPVPAGSA
ncbi:MAG: SRPBCC family protein [Chloroflexota bacterium]|nr:SRPBCC family protein [Chloroflexota bacterium]